MTHRTPRRSLIHRRVSHRLAVRWLLLTALAALILLALAELPGAGR